MDYRPREEEASLELARESLIAISYCEPERENISNSKNPEKPNTKVKAVSAVDELRSKLISIASEPPSRDFVANGV